MIVDPASITSNEYLNKITNIFDVNDEREALIFFASVSVIMLCCAAVIKFVNHYMINMYSARCQNRLANDMMTECISAPYSWFLKHNSALITRLFQNDITDWGRSFVHQSLLLLDSTILTVIAIGTVLFVTPLTGLIGGLVIGGIAVLSLMSIRRKLNYIARYKKESQSTKMLVTYQMISGIREVKFSNSSAYFLKLFNSSFVNFCMGHHKSSLLHQIPNLTIQTVGQAGLVIIATILGLSDIPPADLAANVTLLVLIASRIVPAINQASSRIIALWSFVPWLDGIHDFRESLREASREDFTQSQAGKKPINKWSVLDCEHVGFKYEGTSEVALNQIQLTISKGKSYGLVGVSGSGKSTLVALLVGLLRPTDGDILIDGKSLSDCDVHTWHKKIGYVTQEPFISDATLLSNIAYGRPKEEIDIAQVEWCIEKANLTHLVEQLPDGLNTKLGDRGANLSGGQRQRISIARALYKKPEILVLDEATSALDNISETKVLKAIENLYGELTIIAVAHRLSTLRNVDQIIVMGDKGSIVGQGTFTDLLQTNTHFQQLNNAPEQSDGGEGKSSHNDEKEN
ncbi:ABC transporter ATP-binding protein [Magnetovibrio sp. PR-2]|uniref:ABC transporter ATP-binding protein n=1 Tax=Magnetovibrio sp. PR-2 TaxID=3120356 RepID=UPI002FCE031A